MKRAKPKIDAFISIKKWNEVSEYAEQLQEIEQEWTWVEVDDVLSDAGEKVSEALGLVRQYLENLANDIKRVAL